MQRKGIGGQQRLHGLATVARHHDHAAGGRHLSSGGHEFAGGIQFAQPFDMGRNMRRDLVGRFQVLAHASKETRGIGAHGVSVLSSRARQPAAG